MKYPEQWRDIARFDGPEELSRSPFTEGAFFISIGFQGKENFYFVLTLDERKNVQDYLNADPESFVSHAIDKESIVDTTIDTAVAKQFIITL